MKRSLLAFLSIIVLLSACRTEFERIRSSNDTPLMYKKAMEYYDAGEYVQAQTLFELIIPAYRGKAEAEDIYYKYAYTYYYTGEYILASHYFKNFSNTFYNSPKREEADFMVAYSNYEMSPSFKLDQTYSKKAIEAFQLFINSHPNSPRVEECNDLIDEIRAKLELKAFEQGKLYFHLRNYAAAVQSFEIMMKDFPESERVEDARYYICIASFLLAQNSVFSKKEERYLEAEKKSEEFLKRYKSSDYTAEIRNNLNNIKRELNQLNHDRYQG